MLDFTAKHPVRPWGARTLARVGVSGPDALGARCARRGWCTVLYLVARDAMALSTRGLVLRVSSHVAGTLDIGVDDVAPQRVLHLLPVCM